MLPSQSVPNSRRSKKRPSYGIRTVELPRGPGGFGFTLSGQGPCILSNIVVGSPADRAGLKPGDHVIAANGRNVSKSPHEDVVQLIGTSTHLKLQIAENYVTSSDDDVCVELPLALAAASDDEEYTLSYSLNPRPPVHVRGNSADSTLTESSHVDAQRPRRPSPRKKSSKVPRQTPGIPQNSFVPIVQSPQKNRHHVDVDLKGGEELHFSEHEINSFLHPTLNELRKSIKQFNSRSHQVDIGQSISKSVVGYLGTIEMPKDSSAGDATSLQAIRNCIRRLRVEKKVHTMVLMCIFDDKITLINHHGSKLADYLSDQITFCGMCTDDKRFFGLVTSRQSDESELSSSCHVFMTEAVSSRSEMERRAKAFGFEVTEADKEFPANSDPIIESIMTLYGKGQQPREGDAASSHSANTSSSSNSDSGIGFRDELMQVNSADRVLLLDVQNQRIQMQNLSHLEGAAAAPESSGDPPGKFTVRAMPDPKSANSGFNTEQLDSQHSAENIRQSMQKYLQSKNEHLKKVSEQLARKYIDEADDEDEDEDVLAPGAKYRPVKRTPSDRSFVRSLEDLREAVETRNRELGIDSRLTNYLYNSETNLPGLSFASTPMPQVPQVKQSAPSSVDSDILRPCDQYPSSEPGVLKQRPLSALSRNTEEESAQENDAEFKGADSRGGWARSSSLRKHLSRRSLSSSGIDQVGKDKPKGAGDVIITDEKDLDSISQTGSQGGDQRDTRVGSWAADFEKLLGDPAGLQTFTEFLKKEFSHENIYFWIACERYRTLPTLSDRQDCAREILARHLSPGATEPVNIDSQAKQAVQDGITSSGPNLFAPAQKQIYNLMKFDSFSRFLKSDLYKDALMAELAGKPLPYPGQLEHDLRLDSTDDDKSKSKAEESRRRSLLPWNNFRGKDRSKSKDRMSIGEAQNKGKKPVNKTKEESRLSLMTPASTSSHSDCDGCTLARVILPDKATTVVQTRNGETIRGLVARLLEKRALRFTSFDVFVTNSEKPLDLSEDCSILGCTEVRVEPRVLFRLELPSKESIGVKAKPVKLVKEVLGPILLQYGWNLDAMVVRRDCTGTEVDLEDTVQSIDNSRLVVQAKPAEEINSKLLEELLRSKTGHSNDEQRSTKTDSSRGSDRFRRHGSHPQPRLQHRFTSDEERMPPPDMIPNKAKFKSAMNQPRSLGVTDDLYEGLKLAQRGRLDDQRGTEIRFEMPDFLKKGQQQDKENHFRPIHRQSEPLPRRDVFPTDRDSRTHNDSVVHTDSMFTQDGYLPSVHEADLLFSRGFNDSRGFNESQLSLGMASPYSREAVYETLSNYNSGGMRRWSEVPPQRMAPPPLARDHASSHAYLRQPPPLPPKPRLPSMRQPSHQRLTNEGFPQPQRPSSERGYNVSFV